MTYARHAHAVPNEIPSPARLLALVFAAIILFVLLRFFAGAGPMPLLLSVITGIVQVLMLGLFGSDRDAAASFLRCGFHLGTFAFFVLYPLISPQDAGIGVSSATMDLVGWILLVTVVGFELAYWGTRFGRPRTRSRATNFTLSDRHYKVLHWLLYAGIVAWFLTILDYAVSAGVSVTDVLMSMRGPVAGQRLEFETTLGGRLIIVQKILGGGLLLAATAGSVLIIVGRIRGSLSVAAWVTLALCATGGFLSGSRGSFFYAFTPLLVTSWLRLSRSRHFSVRWMWASTALVLLITAWGAMSAMRGSDIRKFEGGFDAFAPTLHAKGALDIYSEMAIIVQAFPDLIPYEHGRSLVPLVLGWVPRVVWPDKPYPFAIHMNFLKGESLENRSASIAVGLPGEGYGNFGIFGVFLWAALVGLACRRGDDYIGDFHADHPLRLQISAMCAIWVAFVVRGGVPEMFYMGLQVVLLPAGLALYLFRAEKPLHFTLPVYSPTRPLLDARHAGRSVESGHHASVPGGGAGQSRADLRSDATAYGTGAATEPRPTRR